MSSIGPQIPPHLAKRKRSLSQTDDLPPTKIAAPALNHDEIDIDSDDDDNLGPQIPEIATSSTLLPASASTVTANKDEISLDDDSDSDSGSQPVAKAPTASEPKVIGPTFPSPLRVLGPTMPPATLCKKPPGTPTNAYPEPDPNPGSDIDSDSDSDDGYGPALPTAGATAHQFIATTAAIAESEQKSSIPKRDAWMLAPPTESGSRAPDPTKIKSRGFASGRGASVPKSAGISSIWTETPDEKRRRLENAVLGRADESDVKQKVTVPSAADEQKEQERRRKIAEYTQQTRGKSLYEERQEALKSTKGRSGIEEEDDPSKRAFDIKKDMAIGGRLGQGDKKKLVSKAANFGDRFQKGSYL
ncbi:hypothetical protein TD95_004072 [Thielaviopsis punctulata]|uniref:DUF3752 domain-containing protein n=1 Tax=Thielaviopsis punctulata TaxID=72032 RepID=A0A0F4ZDA3_9PEZI|nr:hypothetical protein TD95_004072 [Thielaviopsis punctulata]